MGLQIDLSQTGEPEKLHDQPGRVEPGCGMALIQKFEEYTQGGSAHDIHLEIVAWTVPDEVGKVHQQSLWMTDRSGKGWPMKVLTNLAIASGLWTADQVRQMQQSGNYGEFDPQEMVGRPVMVRLVEEPDNRDPSKVYVKIGGVGIDVFNLNDPKAADFPRHAGLFNQWSPKIGFKNNAPNPKPATGTAGAANPKSDPFANV